MLSTFAFLVAVSVSPDSPIALRLIRKYGGFEPRIFGDGSEPDRIYVQNYVFLTPGRWFREVLEIDPVREDPGRVDLKLTGDHMIGKNSDQLPVYLDSNSAIGPTTGKNGVVASEALGRTIFVQQDFRSNQLGIYWKLSVPLTSAVWDHESTANLLAVVGKTPSQSSFQSLPSGAVYESSGQQWTPEKWDGNLDLYRLGKNGEFKVRTFMIREKVLGDISALCFLGEDELLVNANLDVETKFTEGTIWKPHERRIYILDLTTGEVDFVHRMADSRMEGRMAVSADNQYLAYCADARSLELFKITRLGESQR